MARLKVCPYCGESIKKDSPNVPYKGRNYHSECFDKFVKEVKKEKDKKLEKKSKKTQTNKKPKAELKDALSEEEYKEKRKYYDYLHQLIEGKLSAKIYALTEDYIKRYDFTYPKMYNTLYYLKEIKEKDLKGDIVGLIPYYYSEAENYFEEIEEAEKQNKNIDLSTMYKTKTVVVKPSKGNSPLLINIEDF